ncbi:hypothetical protein ISP_008053 [Amycolatopsis mediterranei]|nr:hypothetical protein [Amycolatopsis mediterranei]UZF76323.1 hypothetical protein ISP_008053 [Amycolatopsis mediterranei]
MVPAVPPSSAWAARTQTLAVSGSSDGTTFDTLAPATAYPFDPARGDLARRVPWFARPRVVWCPPVVPSGTVVTMSTRNSMIVFPVQSSRET